MNLAFPWEAVSPKSSPTTCLTILTKIFSGEFISTVSLYNFLEFMMFPSLKVRWTILTMSTFTLQMSILFSLLLKDYRHSMNHTCNPFTTMEYWFCLSCHKKMSETGWLKQQQFISHSLEAGSPWSWCQQMWFLLRSCCLVCRWLHSCCALMWFFLRAHTPYVSSSVHVFFSCKDTIHIVSGPTLTVLFQFNHIWKGPISKYSHSLR